MNRPSRAGEQQHRYADKERQAIIDLWVRTPNSSGRIAQLLGMRRNQIMGMCDRFMKRKNFPSRAHLQSQCMNQSCDDWWNNGPTFDHTVTPIARNRASGLQLAVNRGGGQLKKRLIKQKTTPTGQGMKMQRLQVVGNTLSVREQEKRKIELEARAAQQQNDYAEEQRLAEKVREGHEFFSDPVPGEPLTILDLRYGMCRAVIGEHPRLPGGMYCGSKVATRAYCMAHHKLFYTKREPNYKGIARMGTKMPIFADFDAVCK